MAKNIKDVEATVQDTPVEGTVELDTTQPLAEIVLEDDGYHVVDLVTGEKGPVCKLVDEGDKTIALTKNSANRFWANRAKADAAIKESGSFKLYYKESKHFGPAGTKMPNEKLIAYLPQELQDEYKAIIDRAIAARDAEKAQPKTELEKAREKVERAQKALDKLLADASGNTDNGEN